MTPVRPAAGRPTGRPHPGDNPVDLRRPAGDAAVDERDGRRRRTYCITDEGLRELRSWLAERGLVQESDTDTETVAILANHFLSEGATPEESVELTADVDDIDAGSA